MDASARVRRVLGSVAPVAASIAILVAVAGPGAASPSAGYTGLVRPRDEVRELRDEVQPLGADEIELRQTLRLLRRQLQFDPDNVELRWLSGLCSSELDEVDAAIRDLEFVVRREPRHQDAAATLALAYNNKAYLLYKEGRDFVAALAFIERAIALDPRETFYLGTKAEVLYQLGRYEEALRNVSRALRDYPDHSEMRADLERVKAALARQREDAGRPVR